MVVTVDALSIRCGSRRNACLCPIALALIESGKRKVAVYGETVEWSDRAGAWFARLPPEASRFVRRFDAGEPVEPFEFAVDPVTSLA